MVGNERLFLSIRIFLAMSLFLLLTGLGFYFVSKTVLFDENRRHSADKAKEVFPYSTVGGYELPKTYKELARPAKDRFTLEFDIMSSQQEAEARILALEEKGIRAYYTPLSRDGVIVYRIRKGLYDTQEGAKNAAKKIQHSKKLKTAIVKL